MNPLDLAKSQPWTRATFTTYALSLSFFEAVLLDRLVRGGTKQAAILVDPDGIKAAISEQGARRAGRDYRLEPVAPQNGYFHPKLSLFETDDDCHLLVGSGNLTFGGWGSNLETIEHLHPSFAADAFDDAAEFFQLLSVDDTIRMEAQALCFELGERLSQVPRGPRSGAIRILHSVGDSIASKLKAQADELGGATRLVAAAPYFDSDGKALAQLATELELQEVFVHAHPTGTVRGSFGSNWPVNASIPMRPVCIESLASDTRHLHAKCLEVVCNRGRLLLTGSANATGAALAAGKNIECAVLRVESQPGASWSLQSASAPDQIYLPAESDSDATPDVGVLRAELNGDLLEGLVLRPRMSGQAEVSVVTQRGKIPLGTATIDVSGRFELLAPGLEMDSWSAGRLTVRVQQADRSAIGFLTIGIAFELAKRAGPMGVRIAALLSGSETPEDVAAVFGWLNEDPTRVPSVARAGSTTSNQNVATGMSGAVTAADLVGPLQISSSDRQAGTSSSKAWERLYDLLRAAFRSGRGRFEADEVEGDDAAMQANRNAHASAANRQVERNFPVLLESMLRPQNEGCFALIALDMANYVSDRFEVEPGVARSWLQRCLLAVPEAISESDKPIVAAAAQLYFGSQEGELSIQAARRYLLQRSLLDVLPASAESSLAGFNSILGFGFKADSFRHSVLSHLTPGEEVSNYRRALEDGAATEGFDSLKARPQWPELERALRMPRYRSKIVFTAEAQKKCPCCPMSLPTGQLSDLQLFGVATATNCCGRTILSEAV